jgi:hypothetical protein
VSQLHITGMTVSMEFGDKTYGNGTGRFISVSSKVPETTPGIPLEDSDDVMKDGLDLFSTALMTLQQTRYATGEIDAEQFKKQTAGFFVRMGKIQQLYQKIKGKTTEELEAFLAKAESEPQ